MNNTTQIKFPNWGRLTKRKLTYVSANLSNYIVRASDIWFNILSKDVLKGAVWKSKKQLVKQIIQYIETYNTERAKPFEWTYDGKKKNSSSNIKSLH